MNDLIIHPLLRQQLDAYAKDPAHAVLLYGKKAGGKKALAASLANQLKSAKPYSVIIYIRPLEGKKIIAIDQIRQLKTTLRTKSDAYRIIVIPDAELMNHEAQNTFLKLLEEPPRLVIFILTSSNEYALLATIRSRVLKLRYISPTIQQQQDYIAGSNSEQQPEKLLAIAGGRMGLLSALLPGGESSHEIIQAIEIAKDILSESAEDRLTRVDTLSKDGLAVTRTLEALLLACNAALETSINNHRQYNQWLKRLSAVSLAYDHIAHNISAKLVLSRLFLVL